MANIVGLDLNIDQDYLANAVQQSVMMGIAESLNGKNEIVSQIVRMVLSTKVTDKGTISNYSNDNRYTLLEFYVRKLIREVTEDEMNKMVDEHRGEIADAIRKELNKQTCIDDFVNRFVKNISDSVNNTWCPKIQISFDQHNEY